MNYYYFADIEVKANKEKEYHKYWYPRGVKSHLEKGAEHVATFKVISGAESTTHVKRLFKIVDLNAWAKGEAQTILSDEWAELAYNVKVTLLAPEPYAELERFLVKGVSENEKPFNYYFLADVELKANKEKEYHKYWYPRGVKSHLEKGGEHVATFKVISGAESTTHVKRLFKIIDLNAWAKGEAQTILSDEWAELAYNVKVTLLAPEPYSNLR